MMRLSESAGSTMGLKSGTLLDGKVIDVEVPVNLEVDVQVEAVIGMLDVAVVDEAAEVAIVDLRVNL